MNDTAQALFRRELVVKHELEPLLRRLEEAGITAEANGRASTIDENATRAWKPNPYSTRDRFDAQHLVNQANAVARVGVLTGQLDDIHTALDALGDEDIAARVAQLAIDVAAYETRHALLETKFPA